MQSMNRQRKRRKLKADINVVPYIDVMLVLLIIFMVTAPLLNLGVDVDLPKSKAHALEQKNDQVTVAMTSDGHYLLKLADAPMLRIGMADLQAKVGAIHRQNPDAVVYVAADGKLAYQQVMDLMSTLQSIGVSRVSLISQPARTDAGGTGKR